MNVDLLAARQVGGNAVVQVRLEAVRVISVDAGDHTILRDPAESIGGTEEKRQCQVWRSRQECP